MTISFMHLSRLWTIALFGFVVVLSGCMAHKLTAMSDKQMFQSIQIGMSRVEAEKILGHPLVEVGNEVYYGKLLKIETWQSPLAPASIVVVYSTEGVVQSKKFYGGNN